MIASPEINFQRTPVTLILAALILAVAAVCYLEPERSEYYYTNLRLGMSAEIWQREVWRPFTTTLLHGDVLHAVFNVYWLAVFGPLIEGRLGSLKTLGLILLFAYVSSLLEFAGDYYLFRGAWEVAHALNLSFLDGFLRKQIALSASGLVGLSGVNYGLFGLAWAASWRDSEFRMVCNRDTIRLMLVWLVFCLVATLLGWMRVANMAHASGLGIGLLVGQAIFSRQHRRWWIAAAVICSLFALALLIAAPGHPFYDNFI